MPALVGARRLHSLGALGTGGGSVGVFRFVPGGDADTFYVVTPSPWGTAFAYRFQRNLGGSSGSDVGTPWQPWRRTGVYELATVGTAPTSPIFTYGEDTGAFDYTMQRGTLFVNGGSYHGGEVVVTESVLLGGVAIPTNAAKTGISFRLEHTSTITWSDATTASVTFSLDVSSAGVLTESVSITSTAAAATETYLGMDIGTASFTRGSFDGGTESDITAAADYSGGTAGTVKLRDPATNRFIQSVSNAPSMSGYSTTFIRAGSAGTNFRKKIYYRKGSTSGAALGTKTAQRTITYSADGGVPDVAYPTFGSTVLFDTSRKANFYNYGATPYAQISDVAISDSPYGLGAQIAIRDSTVGSPQYLAPAVIGAPVDVRNGSILIEWKAIANLSVAAAIQLDRFQIELYSAGTQAAPGANYHQHQFGIGNLPGHLRARSTSPAMATPGRFQYDSFPVSEFVAVGTGADLSAITMVRLAVRSSSGNTVTIALGKIRFVPNPRSKAAFIFGFDDAYASQYTYAFPLLQAAGFKGVFYPGAVNVTVNGVGNMTAAQVNEMLAAGWQFASQAYSTENAAIVDAWTSQQRLDEYAAARTYAQGLGRRADSFDGSFYSGVGPTDLTAQPELIGSFRSLRRYDTALSTGTPMRVGETWPFGDRYNQSALAGYAPGWGSTQTSYVQAAIDQAINNNGVIEMVWHKEFETGEPAVTAAREGFTAAIAYLQSKSAQIDVVTKRQLIG